MVLIRSVLILLCIVSPLTFAKQLTFSCATSINVPDSQYARALVKSVARKIGDQASVLHLSTQEIQRRYKLGMLDGDCGRLAGFAKSTGLSDLRRVDFSFGSIALSLWGGPQSYTLLSTSRIGLISGTPVVHKHVSRLSTVKPIIYSNIDDLLIGLRDGEIDYMASWYGPVDAKKAKLKKYKISYHSHLGVFPLYIYVHQKHTKLAERINDEILRRRKLSAGYKYYSDDEIPASSKVIVFSCSLSQQGAAYKRMTSVLKQAFSAMGREFKMIWLSRAREKKELRKGTVDGSCLRLPEVASQTGNLEVVPVIAANLRAAIWGFDPNRSVPEVFSKEASYAYVKGSTVFKSVIEEHGLTKVEPVGDVDSGLKMLVAHRFDYLMAIDAAIEEVFKYMVVDKTFYVVKRLPMQKYYPLISKKHADLIEPLTQQLNNYLEADKLDRVLEGVNN